MPSWMRLMIKNTPPRPKREPVSFTQMGRTRTDAYHWLKDKNWQQVMRDPSLLRSDIKEYLELENAYTKAHLEDPQETICEELVVEIRGRIKEDDSSVPAIDGPYAYYSRYRAGEEYPVFARRTAENAFNAQAEETILFDGPLEAEGKAYFDITEIAHSPDHKLLAYCVDEKGSEYATIRVRDIETAKDMGVLIDTSNGDIVWTRNSRAFYWVHRNEHGRTDAVYRRNLSDQSDTLIFTESDEGYFVGVSESQSGDLIFISTHDHTTSEWFWISADETERTELTLISARQSGHEYSVVHHDDSFFILTNIDGATDFKIMRSDLSASGTKDWNEIVPHRPGTLILGLESLKNHLIRLERHAGLPHIIIRERTGGKEETINFDEAAYSLGLSGGYEYNTQTLRLTYASPSTPTQIFDYQIDTKEKTLRKTQMVPSGHDPKNYKVERFMATATDGAEIPVTLLRRADTPVDGSAPLLLYGYGAYGITIPASFSVSRLSLVDRGFIYAIAHIRGSTAKGYQWYLDGKLGKKINTFTDYIAVANSLIEKKYTQAGQIIGEGGSAGGLLMGAVANLAPQLFAGIIAAVPFVDVLNTMSDASLPLTPPEWPEWGNPLEDAEAYDHILSWSPYDQVADKVYPAMLITGGLTDTRVTYWEPAKWVAQLRYMAPKGGPYYLKINMDAGHSGATGRFEGLKEVALNYAFALKVTGKT